MDLQDLKIGHYYFVTGGTSEGKRNGSCDTIFRISKIDKNQSPDFVAIKGNYAHIFNDHIWILNSFTDFIPYASLSNLSDLPYETLKELVIDHYSYIFPEDAFRILKL